MEKDLLDLLIENNSLSNVILALRCIATFLQKFVDKPCKKHRLIWLKNKIVLTRVLQLKPFALEDTNLFDSSFFESFGYKKENYQLFRLQDDEFKASNNLTKLR